jgi:hypothetical protein
VARGRSLDTGLDPLGSGGSDTPRIPLHGLYHAFVVGGGIQYARQQLGLLHPEARGEFFFLGGFVGWGAASAARKCSNRQSISGFVRFAQSDGGTTAPVGQHPYLPKVGVAKIPLGKKGAIAR